MHFEWFATVSDAFLGVEDGAGAGAFDHDGGEEEDGAEEDEGQQGEDDVEHTFDAVLPFLHEAGVDGDERGVEDAMTSSMWCCAMSWGTSLVVPRRGMTAVSRLSQAPQSVVPSTSTNPTKVLPE